MPRPGHTLRVVVTTGIVALLLATGWSRYRWGYWFQPPAVPREVASATKLVAAGPYSRYNPDPPWRLNLESHRPSSDEARQSPRFRDAPMHRVSEELHMAGLVTSDVVSLTTIEVAGRVKPFVESHPDFQTGIFYELEGPDGRFSVLCAETFPTDHRRYMEMLARPASDGGLREVRGCEFSYDSADLELLTWHLVFAPLWGFLACLAAVFLFFARLLRDCRAHST